MPISALPALLHVPGLVQQEHRAVAAEMVDHEPGHVVPDPVMVPRSARQESVHHRRGRVPTCSAIVQQFLRGNSASNPRTIRSAVRRGSTRPNRPAVCPIRSLNNDSARPGSKVWPTATAAFFVDFTNHDE